VNDWQSEHLPREMGELGEERLKKTGRGTENKSKSYRDLEVVDRESSARKVNKTEEED